jgi:hypothetical protein
MTAAFDLVPDEMRLLAEVGFVGIGRARFAEAQMIFAAMRAMRPQGEAGFVGGALAALGAGRPDDAAALLRAAPQTESVLAFRAIVHGQIGDHAMVRELVEDLGFMRGGPSTMEIARGAMRS